VTTGFANLSDGARVLIGTDDRAPTADLAPRKRSRSPDAKGDAKGGQGKDGEPRGKRERGEGDQKGQTGPAAAEPSGAAKSRP
jgi:multidrug efflux system membrane fusion protein